ncbi:MAG: MinD/ParA family protein [Deferribacteraceae bacterium]|jgi:flagellar biosynthesis protein FlhG|nr:MinD/ParA family protein [Deferribacteraceae bacterium]
MERELIDQADNLRKFMWERGHHATYLAVTSGKGGVGKTTFVVNYACMLAQTGKKVLVFDADLGLANIDIMLKVSPKAAIKDYIDGKASIGDVLIKGVFGFDLFPASSGFIEMADTSETDFEKIRNVFVKLDTQYDYIIFDTGAGIANNVHRFAAMADYAIVVSQPEPTAIADAYAFLKTAKQLYSLKAAYLVFNKVDDAVVARKVYQNLKDVAQRFLQIELHSAGNLADEPQARKALRAQKPLCVFAPDSDFTKGVKEIANKTHRIWGK